MSDLPDLKNEPTIELSEFSRQFRSAPEQPIQQDVEPPKSPYRHIPALLGILLALVWGWHWFAAIKLERHVERQLQKLFGGELPEGAVAVNVNPLTNLLDIQFTRSVRGRDASSEFFEDAVLEYATQQIEPLIERELSHVARRKTDLYAMLVPYQVSITVDRVRLPPAPPPSRLVQEIQRQLSARGYQPGPADGRLGARTREAIEAFQRDHKLIVDGSPSGELLDNLRNR